MALSPSDVDTPVFATPPVWAMCTTTLSALSFLMLVTVRLLWLQYTFVEFTDVWTER